MKKKLTSLVAGVVACLLLLTAPVLAQNKTVSGKVTDASGNPIAGASVIAKGTTIGTQTDAAGAFSFSVPANTSSLIVSSVGFSTLEIGFGSGPVNAVMASSASNLNEVVVVGYGTARKKDLTGAVGSVKSKDFLQGVFTAPDQAIQGKVAGVQVINNSGAPGGATTIRIRGISSIRSGNDPLVVVDGVPLSGSASPNIGTELGGAPANNPLNFINPSDIASMDVLKDASATAIFGSRGANGVIMITTKKGSTGAPKVEAGASVGFGSPMKKYDVLNGDEYRKALTDYGIQGGNFGANSDAFDAILRSPAVSQNYNVAVSGGNETGRYRASFGYLDQQGIIKDSRFQKFSSNVSGAFKFLQSRKLGLDFNLIATGTLNQGAPISNDAGFQGSLIGNALQWNPTANINDWSRTRPVDPRLGATTINPLALLDAWDDRTVVNTVVLSVMPYYKITDWLEYRMMYAVNHEQAERRTEMRSWINIQNIEGRGYGQIINNRMLNQTLTHTLNFNKDIAKDIVLNATLGYEYLKYDFRGSGMTGRRFVDYPNLKYTDYMQNVPAADLTSFSYFNPVTELQSYFGRANVNWKDKLLVTATVRADGSTKFGSNNKYGVFPSVAAAYNLGNEEFLKGNSVVSGLKVRGSWGQTGNQEFPSGAPQLITSIGRGDNLSLSNLANDDLKWETNTMTNIGVDFGLFSGKLSGSLDWYTRSTTDALFQQNVVQPGPAYRFWVNLPGEIVNSGFEVALNWEVMRKKDFVWNIGGNIAFQKNEVRDLVGAYETGALHGQGISGATSQRIVSGQPLNVFYLRKFLGIDKTSGQSVYEDDGNTLYYVGSPNPKTVYGINTDFTFKNKLSLIINMNGAAGHYVYNNTLNTVLPIGNLGTRNIGASLIGGDVKENRSNAIAPSTRYMEQGDYLKLANATLTYRVGDLAKTFKNVTFSLTGQNLFVITKFNGFDPEVNVNKSVNGIPSLGIEYIPYPTARNIVLGVNFGL